MSYEDLETLSELTGEPTKRDRNYINSYARRAAAGGEGERRSKDKDSNSNRTPSKRKSSDRLFPYQSQSADGAELGGKSISESARKRVLTGANADIFRKMQTEGRTMWGREKKMDTT